MSVVPSFIASILGYNHINRNVHGESHERTGHARPDVHDVGVVIEAFLLHHANNDKRYKRADHTDDAEGRERAYHPAPEGEVQNLVHTHLVNEIVQSFHVIKSIKR